MIIGSDNNECKFISQSHVPVKFIVTLNIKTNYNCKVKYPSSSIWKAVSTAAVSSLTDHSMEK